LKYFRLPIILIALSAGIFINACNYTTHRSLEKPNVAEEDDPQPNYDITLGDNYQDFTTFMFMGNRSENFSTYFNTYFMAQEDFETALIQYRNATLSSYNKKLDSLNITPQIASETKEKLNKVIERASKVIQLHKSSKFLDDAVLLIGKSYFLLGDYLQAERKFNEFLTNLSQSELYDEAMYYLGVTKLKIRKTDEAKIILKNLLKNAKDNEVRSETAQELGIDAFVNKNYQDAITYFKQSIDLTSDKDNKAVKQFILARIYSLYEPVKAAAEFDKVLDYSSDFDLAFYARLNYSKALDNQKGFAKANEELDDLRRKYREVPEYKQLAELELANNLYSQKKYKEAMTSYFDVIIDYPSSLSASDAYYFLANHYETVENNYLKALVNYRKSVEENGSSDFASLSRKKSETFTRYFDLKSKIDTSYHVTIPTENTELEKRRVIKNEENGIFNNNQRGTTPPLDNNGKGSGVRSKGNGFNALSDTLKSEDPKKEEVPDIIEQKKEDVPNIPNEKKEEIQEKKEDIIEEPQGNDTTAIINGSETDTSLVRIEYNESFNHYYEIAELFLYDLKKVDSSIYYLDMILQKFPEEDKQAKTLFTLASIYSNNSNNEKADDLHREIIRQYPNTIFANESRKILGLTAIELEEEAVKEIYKDAEKRLMAGASRDAVDILTGLTVKYPESELLPKAYFTLGWIYENVYKNRDSVVYYYKILKNKYPSSEYAVSIGQKLTVLDITPAKDTSKTNVSLDSLGNQVTLDSLGNQLPFAPGKEAPNVNNGEIKNPGETKTKDMFEGKTPEEIQKLLQDEVNKENNKIEQPNDPNLQMPQDEIPDPEGPPK